MIRGFYHGLLGSLPSGSKLLKVLIRAGVSLSILWLLFWWLPTESLLTGLKSIPAHIWFLVFCGYIGGHIVSAYKWRLLLSAVMVRISAIESVRAHGAGLFANLCLPSVVGGDFVRAGVIVRQHGNVEAIALGSLTDRLNDTLALVLIAGVAGLLVSFPSDLQAGQILTAIAMLMLLAIVGGVLFVLYVPMNWLPSVLQSIVSKFRVALRALLQVPHIAVFTLLMSIVIQSFFIILNIAIAQAIGISASVPLWFFAWPLAKLIALAPISLGGIGVREMALGGIMLPFGFETAHVVAQGLAWQAVLILSGLFCGIVVTLLPVKNVTPQIMERR